MPVYNKLVRNLILQIIENSGSEFTIRTLDSSEHLTEIKKKLNGEVQQFQETMNHQEALEELADILELIYAALPIHEQHMRIWRKFALQRNKNAVDLKKGFGQVLD